VKYYARISEKTYECSLEAENGRVFVEVDGVRYEADLQHVPHAHAYSLLLDGRSYEFTLHEGEEGIELAGGAGLFRVEVEDARTHAAREATAHGRADTGPAVLKAVMPGIVRDVMTEAGAAVEKGQALLILEAMKMQNEIRAERAGTVSKVHVGAGETVDKGAPLLEIE
jgi:biotin carboxyl carrier protein